MKCDGEGGKKSVKSDEIRKRDLRNETRRAARMSITHSKCP